MIYKLFVSVILLAAVALVAERAEAQDPLSTSEWSGYMSAAHQAACLQAFEHVTSDPMPDLPSIRLLSGCGPVGAEGLVHLLESRRLDVVDNDRLIQTARSMGGLIDGGIFEKALEIASDAAAGEAARYWSVLLLYRQVIRGMHYTLLAPFEEDALPRAVAAMQEVAADPGTSSRIRDYAVQVRRSAARVHACGEDVSFACRDTIH